MGENLPGLLKRRLKANVLARVPEGALKADQDGYLH